MNHLFTATLKDIGFRDVILDGTVLTLGSLSVTLVFEFFSVDTVEGVWKQPNGKQLYRQAWIYNVFNHMFLGLPVYVLAVVVFCTDKEPAVESWNRFTFEVVWILAMHAIQYYTVHKAFHDYPILYRTFHRFHHRFNVHTPPSSANAVTPGEYLVAYIFPFLLPLVLLPISPSSMRVAAAILSFLNVLVHTPKLESISMKVIPSFWVSTNNHLDHHRKLTSHYASPTFNIDNLVQGLKEMIASGQS